MPGFPSRTASLICLLSLMTGLVMAAPAPAAADEKRVTVTFGNPGDRWLDAMKYIRVARAQHDGTFGYAVTFQAQGLEDFTWFWPRKDIDLDGSDPAYQQRSLTMDSGNLYYPDRITARSLPDVHRAILIVEADYLKQSRGGMAVAEAFNVIAALGASIPTRGAGLASRSSTSAATARGVSARPIPAKPVPRAAKPAPAKPAPAKPAPAKPAPAKPATSGTATAQSAGGANAAEWTPAMAQQLTSATKTFRGSSSGSLGEDHEELFCLGAEFHCGCTRVSEHGDVRIYRIRCSALLRAQW